MKECKDITPPRDENSWVSFGVTWTKEDKEALKKAIKKVRKLEGLD